MSGRDSQDVNYTTNDQDYLQPSLPGLCAQFKYIFVSWCVSVLSGWHADRSVLCSQFSVRNSRLELDPNRASAAYIQVLIHAVTR